MTKALTDLMVARLCEHRILTREKAEALSIAERDRILGVAGWGGYEEVAWREALGRLGADWAPEQDAAAAKEGWGIFACHDAQHPPFELERIDFAEEGEVQLEDDTVAWRIVREGAAVGNPLHVAALRFLEVWSPVEHRHVVNNISYADEPYFPEEGR